MGWGILLHLGCRIVGGAALSEVSRGTETPPAPAVSLLPGPQHVGTRGRWRRIMILLVQLAILILRAGRCYTEDREV